jgi:hypothetical protein
MDSYPAEKKEISTAGRRNGIFLQGLWRRCTRRNGRFKEMTHHAREWGHGSIAGVTDRNRPTACYLAPVMSLPCVRGSLTAQA